MKNLQKELTLFSQKDIDMALLLKLWRSLYKTVSLRRYDKRRSRATDDLDRSKYGITNPPVGQLYHLKLSKQPDYHWLTARKFFAYLQ